MYVGAGSLFAILFVSSVLALIPAHIAEKKGRDFANWWLFGTFFWLVALICAVVIEPDRAALDRTAAAQGLRRCPYCAEFVRPEAVVCRFCGYDVPRQVVARKAMPEPESRDADGPSAGKVAGFVLGGLVVGGVLAVFVLQFTPYRL